MGDMISVGNIAGNLIFSGIGFVALMYAKKQGNFQLMGVGALLMVFPYFVSGILPMFLVGSGLTAAAWAVREN